MWIRVAMNDEAIHKNTVQNLTYIDGGKYKEYYFGDEIAKKLEEDHFLTEMWTELDALFDWGDCDFFYPERCKKFKIWLTTKLENEMDSDLKQIYEVMLEYANIAVEKETGICFDF